MEKLTWYTEKRRLKDLIPLEKNPFGKITEEKKTRLKNKLDTLGVFEIPTIDTNNELITFNKRYHCLLILWDENAEIDCRIPSRQLNENERKEIIVSSNIHEGEWDIEILEVDYTNIDLVEIGLDIEEIELKSDLDSFDSSILRGETDSKPQNFIIKYEIIFNNETEQKRWMEFIRELKNKYSTLDTISERIIQFINDNSL